jgi:hypothetical protein
MKLTLLLFGSSAAELSASVSTARRDEPTRKVEIELKGARFPTEAAQWVFRVSNTPEDEELWRIVAGADVRAVAVGDVVEVRANTHRSSFLCLSSGWADITLVAEDVISRLESAGGPAHRRQLATKWCS